MVADKPRPFMPSVGPYFQGLKDSKITATRSVTCCPESEVVYLPGSSQATRRARFRSDWMTFYASFVKYAACEGGVSMIRTPLQRLALY